MNSEDFSGKTILVTGAARGLGLKIAAAFHGRGGMVMLNDLDAGRIAQAIASLGGGERLAPAAADISTVAGCESIVDASLKRFGRLDVVVNNAAINWEMPIEAHTEEIWDKHLDTILKGSFFITRAAIPALKSSKGNVVNIASELGLRPIINNVAYCAAKGGLVNMTRALAVELAPAIRVNCVCPGSMDTELMRECADASGDRQGLLCLLREVRRAEPDRHAGGSGGNGAVRRLGSRRLHDRLHHHGRWRQHGRPTRLGAAASA